jgi:pimeloyl-ACP methyl ester carboxylesterase
LIVLVHSGICDARMWNGFDLPGATPHEMPGFGNKPLPPTGEYSHVDDLEQAVAGEQVALVGASFGALVCLELAARRPDLVTDLVVLDAPLPDHSWSEEMLRSWQHEEALLEQGEWRAAAEWNADFWLSDAAGAELRARVIERLSTSRSTWVPYEPAPSWASESSTSRTCTRLPSAL